MQKIPSSPSLTSVQNPDQSIVSIMILTYILFKTFLVSIMLKGLHHDLHPVQNPDQPIVSIMQKRPPGP
jgi:hypothetical protein